MKKTHFENQKLELFMLNVTIVVFLNKNVGRFTQKVDTKCTLKLRLLFISFNFQNI